MIVITLGDLFVTATTDRQSSAAWRRPGRPWRDLRSVFSTLQPPLVAAAYTASWAWPPGELVVGDAATTPIVEEPGHEAPDRVVACAELWRRFDADVVARLSPDMAFETFFFVFARYAWSVPGAMRDTMGLGYGRAISAFEQWKATAALAHCLEPDAPDDAGLLLINGDIPGWQNTSAGEREVRKALRATLFKYKLHQDAELFDKAYGYLRQYY